MGWKLNNSKNNYYTFHKIIIIFTEIEKMLNVLKVKIVDVLKKSSVKFYLMQDKIEFDDKILLRF